MIRSLLLFFVICILGSSALADKVETIQKLLKDECSKKVSYDQALGLIRPLYLTCVPGTKVYFEKCKVSCLKTNAGAIIGR